MVENPNPRCFIEECHPRFCSLRERATIRTLPAGEVCWCTSRGELAAAVDTSQALKDTVVAHLSCISVSISVSTVLCAYNSVLLAVKSHSILTSESGRVYKSTWNSPSAIALVCAASLCQDVRTFDVILSVRLTCLVVVHHGDNVQQVVLAELLQSVGQLLHVDCLVAPGLLLGSILAADTVGVGRAGVLQQGEELGLGVAEGL